MKMFWKKKQQDASCDCDDPFCDGCSSKEKFTKQGEKYIQHLKGGGMVYDRQMNAWEMVAESDAGVWIKRQGVREGTKEKVNTFFHEGEIDLGKPTHATAYDLGSSFYIRTDWTPDTVTGENPKVPV